MRPNLPEYLQQSLTWSELFSDPRDVIAGGIVGVLLLLALVLVVASTRKEEQ